MSTQKQIWTLLSNQSEFILNSQLKIQEDEFHYLANVLRLKVGEEVEVANGCGQKAKAKITSISKKEAHLQIDNVFSQPPKSAQIHLYLALPKPSTLEDVVSSASEMGVDEIHLFRTERCMSKAPVKIEKLQRLSLEALRISKSLNCSKIFVYENLKDLFLKRNLELKAGLNLFCDESHVYEGKVTNSLLKVVQEKWDAKQNFNLFVGPEASFSDREQEFILKEFGCFGVSLGNNILRVPNAVFAAVGVLVQVLLG